MIFHGKQQLLAGVGVATILVAEAVVEPADSEIIPCMGARDTVCPPGTYCKEKECTLLCLPCGEKFNRNQSSSTSTVDCAKVWQECGICFDGYEATPGQEKCTEIVTTLQPTAGGPVEEGIPTWSIALFVSIIVFCVLCLIAYIIKRARRQSGMMKVNDGDIAMRSQSNETFKPKDACCVLERSHLKKRCISYAFRIALF